MRVWRWVALLMVVVSPSLGDGMACAYLAFRGHVPVPNPVRGMRIAGELALVTTADEGVLTYAYGPDGFGDQLAQIDVDGDIQDVCVVGGYAYAAAYGDGLQVIAIDPAGGGSVVGSLPLPGYTRFVEPITPGRLLVGTGAGVIQVEISDPAAPVVVETVEGIGGSGVKCVVREGEVFVITRGFVLRYAISPEGDLEETARVSHSFATGLACHGAYLYVSKWRLPVRIYEITPQGGLELTGEFEIGDTVQDLRIEGGKLFAAVDDEFAGASVFDLSNPLKPLGRGFAPVEGASSLVRVDGGLVHALSSSYGVYTYAHDELGADSGIGSLPGNRTERVTLIGDRYLAYSGTSSTLPVFGIGSAGSELPELVGSVQMRRAPVALAGGRSKLAVSLGDRGLVVVDPDGPSGPEIVFDDENADVGSVMMDGERLWVSGPEGLKILDLTDASSPVLVGSTGFEIGGMCLAGPYLVGVMGSGLIEIFDISDLQQIVPIAALQLPQQVPGVPVFIYDVSADDRYVYFSTDLAGVSIVPVESLHDPYVISTFDTLGRVRTATPAEDLLCLADFNRGVQVYDISVIAEPRRAGFSSVGSVANDLVVQDGVVYATDLDGGLRVIRLGEHCLCPADLTGDGAVNFFDVSTFLQAFNTGDPQGDWNGDGSFNFFDVSAFLTDFGDGCP